MSFTEFAWTMARRFPVALSFIGFAVWATILGLLFDLPLATYFKRHEATEFVGFFRAITDLGKPDLWFPVLSFIVFMALTAWYMDFREAIKERIGRVITACVFVFLSVALSGLAVNIVKLLAGRHRPRELFDAHLSGFTPLAFDVHLDSFPSGHAQMIFALAGALVIIAPRFDHFYVLVAIAVALSRVVTSVHFLSDTLIGAWVGIAAPVILHRYFFQPRGILVRVQICYRHPGLLRRIRDGLDRKFAYTPPPESPPEDAKDPDDER